MKAIQLTEFGSYEVLKLSEVPIPTIKENEILVKNFAAGINFIDTYNRSGLYPHPLPLVPGVEGSGVVESVGSSVTDFKVGDRVAYMSIGSYGQYTAVPVKVATKIPTNMSFDLASASLFQGLTAYTMVTLAHKVSKGETVLIHAAVGGMGQMLTQLCKHFGATVIGTTSNPQKMEIAKSIGVDHVINYTQEDVLAKVLEITGGKGVNAVFDGVGKDTFNISVKSCGLLATLVLFGNASGKNEPVDVFQLMPKNIKLMRTAVFNFFESKDDFVKSAEPLLKLVDEGKLKVNVHKQYDLGDVGNAHKDLESRVTTGKLILKIPA